MNVEPIRVRLRLDQIVIPDDLLRGADHQQVDKIAISMAERGQLEDIEVRPENAAGKFPLNFGLHRYLAAQKIGLPELRAQVFDGSDDEARLRQIDENLHRHELNPLDEAVFLAERRAIYERLNGIVQRGRPARKNGTRAGQLSFFDDTTERFGLSRKVIKVALTRFNRLAVPVRAMLRGSATARSGREIDALAKLLPEDQFVVAQLLAGTNPPKSVAAALAKVRGAEHRGLHLAKPMSERLWGLWSKAGDRERRDFIERLKQEGFLHLGALKSIRGKRATAEGGQ